MHPDEQMKLFELISESLMVLLSDVDYNLTSQLERLLDECRNDLYSIIEFDCDGEVQ